MPAMATAAEPAASWRNPLVAVAYYSSRDLPAIRSSLLKAKLPRGTPVFYGNYWGTAPRRAPGTHHPPHPPPPVVKIPNGKLTPIFGWTPNKFWTGRRLTSSQERRLGRLDRHHFRGAAPGLYALLGRGGGSAYRWGRELGRRFRDRMRQVEGHGDDVSRWQFDEIPTNALGSSGRKARDLVRGMLNGATYGRPELGDGKLRGIVFAANATLELAGVRQSGELRRFWRTVDSDSYALAGEEYPRFLGDPARSAFVQSGGQRAMAAQGRALGSLASKYVVAVTPGYLHEPGLGGNTRGRSHEGVNAWRADFLHARAQYGPAGFATYDLLGPNGSTKALAPLFTAFADGLRALGSARR